ncbi:hypothetical protein ACFX1S_042958 [Malus domestica]
MERDQLFNPVVLRELCTGEKHEAC